MLSGLILYCIALCCLVVSCIILSCLVSHRLVARGAGLAVRPKVVVSFIPVCVGRACSCHICSDFAVRSQFAGVKWVETMGEVRGEVGVKST